MQFVHPVSFHPTRISLPPQKKHKQKANVAKSHGGTMNRKCNDIQPVGRHLHAPYPEQPVCGNEYRTATEVKYKTE